MGPGFSLSQNDDSNSRKILLTVPILRALITLIFSSGSGGSKSSPYKLQVLQTVFSLSQALQQYKLSMIKLFYQSCLILVEEPMSLPCEWSTIQCTYSTSRAISMAYFVAEKVTKKKFYNIDTWCCCR